MDPPRPAAGAPADELLELAQLVRRELLLLEESPSGAWVEETARDLRDGRKIGWYYPTSDGGGLAFYSARPPDAFAHVHVGAGTDAAGRAVRLATTMLDALPAAVRAVDVGFTGLSSDEEALVFTELLRRPGARAIVREAMERAIGPDDDGPVGSIPAGLVLLPVRRITLDALAELDRAAFAGTVDELLIGRELADYRRVLEALLANEVGRFLDEASTALLEPDPPRLVGALLSTEQSPRRAVFADFLVAPSDRKRGHGRYLLRWGIRALRALGYERVRLWVSHENDAARHLYDGLGFRAVARATIYRWERPASPQPQTAA